MNEIYESNSYEFFIFKNLTKEKAANNNREEKSVLKFIILNHFIKNLQVKAI